LTWLALFAHLFIGYGGAEAGILCIEAHHVKFEASFHVQSAVPVPVDHKEPFDKNHGDHCLDISLSTGDIQPAVKKFNQTNVHSLTPDIIGVSLPGSALEKNPAKSFCSHKTARESYHLSSLSSVILLI